MCASVSFSRNVRHKWSIRPLKCASEMWVLRVPKKAGVKMYSIGQRVFLVLEFHSLEHSVTATRRSFQRRFNVAKRPFMKIIRRLFANSERASIVANDLVGHVVTPASSCYTGKFRHSFCKCSALTQEIRPLNCSRDWFEAF